MQNCLFSFHLTPSRSTCCGCTLPAATGSASVHDRQQVLRLPGAPVALVFPQRRASPTCPAGRQPREPTHHVLTGALCCGGAVLRRCRRERQSDRHGHAGSGRHFGWLVQGSYPDRQRGAIHHRRTAGIYQPGHW